MAIEMQRLLVTLYYVIVHLLRNLPPSADDAIMQQLTGDEIEELKTAVFRPIIVVCLLGLNSAANAADGMRTLHRRTCNCS